MNYQNETRIESLLNQMQLAEPTRQLDDAIASLADNSPVTARQAARKFSWTALASTAVAASLIGLVAGIATSSEKLNGASIDVDSMPNVSETRIFQTMHGHSGNAKFHDCSACHVFKSRAEQTVKKWLTHERDNHDNLGWPNCSMCHLQSDELISTGLGSKG